jgi:uncharacterized membrane protein
MASPSPSAPSTPHRSLGGISGWIVAGLLLVTAVIVFLSVYLAFPQAGHFYGLLGVGILALFLALGSYFAQALSREPVAQRALGWGFFGMGFGVLFLTIALGPTYGVLSPIAQLFSLLVVLVALIAAVGLISWRIRALRRTAQREVARRTWQGEAAPSAFSYATAQAPDVPVITPPSVPSSEPGSAPAESHPPAGH